MVIQLSEIQTYVNMFIIIIKGLINTDLFCSKVSNIFTVSKLRSESDILVIISIVQCTATMQIIKYSKIIVIVKKSKFENLLEIFVFFIFKSTVTWSESFEKGS